MRKRLIAIVSGRVQGVGYRFFAESRARFLNLTGYVRNLPEGGVEVVAEGEEAVLVSFLNSLRQGPPAAQVREVHVFWTEAQDEFDDFAVRI